jgi:ketosteroid isomerase-like protein
MKCILVFTFLALVTACPALAQSSNDEQELIRLDREWGMASMKGDSAALNRIYADEYTEARFSGPVNKQKIIEEIVKDAANLKNPVYTSDNYNVRFIGNDTAVMTHTGVASGIDNGKPFNEPHRAMHVWVRRNGRWQAFSSFGGPMPDEALLRQLENDWADAAKRHDTAWMEHHYAEGYTWTSPEGTVNDRAKDIAEAKDVTFDSFNNSDMQVRVYGDTAVVTGISTIKGKYKAEDISGTYRFTDTFVKRDGEWMVAASQVTRVAQQTATK